MLYALRLCHLSRDAFILQFCFRCLNCTRFHSCYKKGCEMWLSFKRRIASVCQHFLKATKVFWGQVYFRQKGQNSSREGEEEEGMDNSKKDTFTMLFQSKECKPIFFCSTVFESHSKTLSTMSSFPKDQLSYNHSWRV